MVKDEFPPSFSEYLQQKIRGKFISITDPEKFGLPRVLDSIEVSCKTRQNIRLLANLLYDTAFSLKSPGSMTRLLEQKVPALYLALEDVISHMASDLRGQGHDPVLRQEQYETMVKAELTNKHGLKFRDSSELRLVLILYFEFVPKIQSVTNHTNYQCNRNLFFNLVKPPNFFMKMVLCYIMKTPR